MVELADDVEAAAVFWLLAGFERLLALDLEDDFDALKGGGDCGHGDGGEETCCGDLGDGEAVGGGDGGDGGDDLFADVVAPEGDGNYSLSVPRYIARFVFRADEGWLGEGGGRETYTWE